MHDWETDSLYLVDCATQAPSGHNTQPWFFTIKKGEITLRPNFKKRLPVVDADDHELFISLGCAAENLCIAASKLQYLSTLMVAGDGSIVIRCNRSEGIPENPLVWYIHQRQTNRSVYSGKEISENILDDILRDFEKEKTNHIHVYPQTSHAFQALTQYVMNGNTAQMQDTAFKAELLSWIRFNKKQAEQTRDGLSYAALGAPNLPTWISRPIVKVMLNVKKQNATDLQKIRSASHLVLLTSQENTIPAWIDTGRTLQRLLLRLTQAGIAHAYLNQPCEVPALNRKLCAELLHGAEFAQILLRIGYGRLLPYSLRRPVQAVIQTCV